MCEIGGLGIPIESFGLEGLTLREKERPKTYIAQL
jgi:hypothetical protein